ncbi:SDR family oxidoreductase [Pelagibius litoralis]|uniref:SDR family oxidoreductase n=1 Tax=Pelagibius litoralis TaxID=374515 RepID=A0A967F2P6_9PROT|nr:SDR family oxidoreductase [Pelagibius litoralis]NIA72093.1 SDR family oxidoreductase [Pelagibius litoralis]
MIISLKGRRALVTGSTAGIGFATATALAQAGANVVLNGRSMAAVDAAAKRLAAAIPDAEIAGVAADLGTADGAAKLADEVGELEILVNNVGIAEPKPFFETSDTDWEKHFAVNVMSGMRLFRALLPGMMRRGWGRIIFVSSESALHIPTEMIHYGMTKTAQLAISRGLAEVAAGSGVTVNAVLPGPTRSEGLLGFIESMATAANEDPTKLEQALIENHRPTSLIGRLADVEEVANMIVYLVSPQASATTGAALRVDGGIVRAIP